MGGSPKKIEITNKIAWLDTDEAPYSGDLTFCKDGVLSEYRGLLIPGSVNVIVMLR